MRDFIQNNEPPPAFHHRRRRRRRRRGVVLSKLRGDFDGGIEFYAKFWVDPCLSIGEILFASFSKILGFSKPLRPIFACEIRSTAGKIWGVGQVGRAGVFSGENGLRHLIQRPKLRRKTSFSRLRNFVRPQSGKFFVFETVFALCLERVGRGLRVATSRFLLENSKILDFFEKRFWGSQCI